MLTGMFAFRNASFRRRKSVHDGAEHAHMVGGHAVHAHGGSAAPDIPGADDERDLHAEFAGFGDACDGRFHRGGIVAEFAVALEGFAADFEENALITKFGRHDCSRLVVAKNGLISIPRIRRFVK